MIRAALSVYQQAEMQEIVQRKTDVYKYEGRERMSHKFRQMPVEDRWWASHRPNDNNCWIWLGRPTTGYGTVWVDNHNVYAHKFGYELLIGQVPEGLELDHLCRVRLCVNPSHLEPVTHRVNLLRGESKAAIYARRTHCPKGHPLSGENLKITAVGARSCRECGREWRRNYKKRRRHGEN